LAKREKSISTEVLHKEIDLIQSCINRMAQNSFSCKGWALTLIAGVSTLIPKNVNKLYLFIIILCIDLCFWWLDSFYVLQEKKYREKYSWVIKNRKEGNMQFLYDLNPNNKNTMITPFDKSQFCVAFSHTLLPMYGGIVIMILGFIFFNCWR